MRLRLALAVALALALPAVSRAAAPEAPPAPAPARDPDTWRPLGLIRVRDMTPFGINRLDMLPAHAVEAEPGTFAFELNFTYQNTWALSRNVDRYLERRGGERRDIGPEDVAAILALPGDAYMIDGELGLADLTLHYRFSERLGGFATIPYFYFGPAFLDSTIEGFHQGIGISNAGRDRVPRDRFTAIAHLANTTFVATEAPESDFGDPVVGLRWSLVSRPTRWNLILEGAVKLPWREEERLVSTGATDYGAQLSLQRFFRRNALYLSLATVWFGSPDPGLARDQWLPTAVAGWETRVSRRLNFVAQLYASRSTVQETELAELSDDKFQATIGLVWYYRGHALRFGITENLVNYDNTPDVGVNLSIGRMLGRER
jgi:hypothetical protein